MGRDLQERRWSPLVSGGKALSARGFWKHRKEPSGLGRAWEGDGGGEAKE